MSRQFLPAMLRLAAAASLSAALGSACGGKSLAGDEPTDGGASSQGGTTSQAGSSTKAGQPGSGASGAIGSGGSSASGGSAGSGATGSGGRGGTGSGGSATAGAPGYAGEGCTAPPDPGPCNAYFETWYHDPNTGVCRPGYYGGCGGNANRYGSLAECQRACSGGTPNYDACKVTTDCVVTGAGCCPICDGENVTLHSLIAFNRAYSACSFAADKAGPGDGDVPGACAPCPEPADAGKLRYFVPECVAGQCSVTDLRTSSATACMKDADCRLRRGTSCCETCDAPLIAVANNGSFEKLVCGDAIPPCAACANEDAIMGAVATCVQGRCEVTYLDGASPP